MAALAARRLGHIPGARSPATLFALLRGATGSRIPTEDTCAVTTYNSRSLGNARLEFKEEFMETADKIVVKQLLILYVTANRKASFASPCEVK